VEIELGAALAMIYCYCRRVRQAVASGLLVFAALAGLALPFEAHAQFTAKATASGTYESNSNVYAIDSGAQQPLVNTYSGSTTDYSYGGSLNGTYSWSRQELFASVSAHQIDYQQYSTLNHYEYTADGGLRFNVGEDVDGKLEVNRSHSMVPFLDLLGSSLDLTLLTSQTESFNIGVQVDSEWKVYGSAYSTHTDEPIPPLLGQTAGVTNQVLTENSGTMAVAYQGFGPFTSGFTASYVSGDYSGLTGAIAGQPQFAVDTSYDQITAGVLAKYRFTRTSFDGNLTYSHRDEDGGGSTSAVTGLLDFKDQLTAKTTLVLRVDRSINTYYLNLGSEVDTDAGFTVAWQARYNLSVSLGYTFTYRDFPGPVAGNTGSHLTATQNYANLAISYQPRHWLTISPYANIQTRSTNAGGGNFNATVYGISVSASVGEDGPNNTAGNQITLPDN
jgi:hypothetical protein